MSTTLAIIRRPCDCETTLAAIRDRLDHAKAAGLLDSYEGACVWDGAEVIVALSPASMHPSERGSFACEREVAERVIDRALGTHRGPTERPAA